DEPSEGSIPDSLDRKGETQSASQKSKNSLGSTSPWGATETAAATQSSPIRPVAANDGDLQEFGLQDQGPISQQPIKISPRTVSEKGLAETKTSSMRTPATNASGAANITGKGAANLPPEDAAYGDF